MSLITYFQHMLRFFKQFEEGGTSKFIFTSKGKGFQIFIQKTYISIHWSQTISFILCRKVREIRPRNPIQEGLEIVQHFIWNNIQRCKKKIQQMMYKIVNCYKTSIWTIMHYIILSFKCEFIKNVVQLTRKKSDIKSDGKLIYYIPCFRQSIRYKTAYIGMRAVRINTVILFSTWYFFGNLLCSLVSNNLRRIDANFHYCSLIYIKVHSGSFLSLYKVFPISSTSFIHHQSM